MRVLSGISKPPSPPSSVALFEDTSDSSNAARLYRLPVVVDLALRAHPHRVGAAWPSTTRARAGCRILRTSPRPATSGVRARCGRKAQNLYATRPCAVSLSMLPVRSCMESAPPPFLAERERPRPLVHRRRPRMCASRRIAELLHKFNSFKHKPMAMPPKPMPTSLEDTPN